MVEIIMLFSRFLFTSLMASVLIGIILVVKAIFKDKISARWYYAMWFLLIIKLIIPNLFTTPYNLFDFIVSKLSIDHGIDVNSKFNELSGENQNGMNTWSFPDEYALSINGNHTITLLQILFCIWLIVVLCVLSRAFIYNIKIGKMVKASKPLEDKELWSILETCKDEMKIKKSFRIVESENIQSPALYGLFKPMILLPTNIKSILSEKEIRYVMLHEMAHYKRKDIFFNVVSSFLQVLHWFNPIIWYGFYRMHEDQELACDFYVLNKIDNEEHYDYGATLIKLLKIARSSMYSFTMANVVNKNRGIKERINMISKFKRESLPKKLISIILIAVMGFIGLNTSEVMGESSSDMKPFNIPENTIYEDLSDYFQEYTGSFVLLDLNKEQYHIYNEMLSKERVSPCSTFKIVCSLIGLEAGILQDENTKMSWDGTIYPYEQWNQDQSLDSAFTYSVDWYFETLLLKLKTKELEKYISQLEYGNQNISGKKDFWNESTLKISPIEQVELLKKLYIYDLPFTDSNVDTVKSIMKVLEQDNIVLSGKTGTGIIDNKSINGWFVGYLEKDGQVYIFATNIRGQDNADGKNAREITLSILQDKKIYD
ncbi:BlaR1 family beta-lactam sensor/signal transducer [Sinanaerobacter sp. ZZT-01]|uniref:BlaR1 family beta-lactam sensor/signal transducer n=1 Tax=Sinanaerobacter sp. ZZT-01 TaxID=3111540 RepID=UPI002D782087|nr:BlaR1 family beta-lactam sensor/signal transducer [Sinanaerobacter sp. ZZT-01]WRR92971.1 BlaR1 family beta-lactam sensor/signal transducer [Sinanaerobacter sp. ZZT-01]